jgi:hypothetical protein
MSCDVESYLALLDAAYALEPYTGMVGQVAEP